MRQMVNIFTRDLPDIFSDSDCDPVLLVDEPINCLMYADDTILISQTAEGLQNCLHKLHEYCKKWNLIVNISKSKVMIFNKGGLRCPGNFIYGDCTLEITTDYVYLGINFKPSGVLTSAYNRLADNAKRAMFKIRSFCNGAPVSVALSLFDYLVVPILTYGGEVWAPYLFHRLNGDNLKSICDKYVGENLAMKFYKSVLGVNKFTCNDAIRGDLGRYPVLLTVIQHSIKYFESLARKPRSPLLRKVLSTSNSIQGTSWMNCVRKVILLVDLDLPQDFTEDNFPEQDNNRRMHNILSEKLRIIYAGQWRLVINNEKAGPLPGKEKLRTYAKFKDCFKGEFYLLSQDFAARRILTKLRSSAHKLEIEVGRHRKPIRVEASQRFCRNCDAEEVEDEYHFLMDCPKFNMHREKLWTDLGDFCDMEDWSEGFKFRFLMSGGLDDCEILSHICLFLKNIWSDRFDD